MNEYHLCRGKRLDNGEWVEGYAYFGRNKTYILAPNPSAKIGEKSIRGTLRDSIALYEIDPATVGRCTGLRDCEGRLIFEGDDLCDYFDDDDGGNVLGSLGFVTYRTDEGRWVLAYENGYSNEWTLEDEALPVNWRHLFICGSAHDNPELLGGEQDG